MLSELLTPTPFDDQDILKIVMFVKHYTKNKAYKRVRCNYTECSTPMRMQATSTIATQPQRLQPCVVKLRDTHNNDAYASHVDNSNPAAAARLPPRRQDPGIMSSRAETVLVL